MIEAPMGPPQTMPVMARIARPDGTPPQCKVCHWPIHPAIIKGYLIDPVCGWCAGVGFDGFEIEVAA